MKEPSFSNLPGSGSSSRAGSSGRLAPPTLKLSNIQMLLRQLEYSDENNFRHSSDAELSGIDLDHHERMGSTSGSLRGIFSKLETVIKKIPRYQ